VEILIEQDAVTPVRIFLQFLFPAVHGPAAILVLEENSAKPLEISSATW
jgi:hypothetical protein